MHLNHYDVSYQDAVEYLIQFLQNVATVQAIEKEEKPTVKPEKQIDFITLKEYNSCALSCFTKFYHPLWERDLIGREAMDKFNILFSLQQNKIIIPHYDIDGRLVGIRARAIEPEDIAIGKYMPIRIGNNIYAHQLGFTLYGLNEHKEAIKKTKRAVIFESEKSVLLGETFYGKYSTAVATCGSQLNRFQINLLVKKLGVTDIILAFDKEYTNLDDPKCKIYRQKLIDKCKKYAGLANFYYLFDEHNLLNEKDSPIDKGRDIYEKLVERKIRIE